jgi:hypothetical protein
MKKTSIYLPKRLVSTWIRKHQIILARLPVLLHSTQKFAPTRTRLRLYQQCPDGGVIVSVYWPLSVYNKLHSFATATRISVSLLLAYLLERLETGAASGQGVLSYAFQVIRWDENLMGFQEELRFSSIPPPHTP